MSINVTWRDVARPIIYRVLQDTQGQPYREIRRALREAYPFGMKKYYPYRIWLDEINRQMRRGKYAKPYYRKSKKACEEGKTDRFKNS